MPNDSEQFENTVLALFPPRVPLNTFPVIGAHYGVSIHHYNASPMGLAVDVDPYSEQDGGDTVELNLNGQRDIASAQTPDEMTGVTLYIPKGLLLTDRVNQLVYTVIRGSQNMGTSTPVLTLLYNAIRPGNQDRDPVINGHSELELILPDAIKNGVGADFISAQVCVSYPYCRAYDRIRLNCNGHDVFHTVTELQAPQLGSATPVTVCFTVTRADLESANDHPQFKFSYTVTDQLGNGPDTDSPWSATQTVDVDLAGNRLPAPLLREIQNDPMDDPSIIDLEKLGANPLLLIVLTTDKRFQPGDTISATYTAKLAGQPDVVVTLTGTVEADEFGQKKPCVLEVPNDKVIPASAVQATYTLLRAGEVVASARSAIASVIGEGLPDLIRPRLQKSVNGVLNPLENLQGANGQVELLGFRSGDTVQLIVKGAPDAGSPTFTAKSLNTNSRANFPLDKAFIALNMGKDVELSYVLIRDGKKYPSPGLPASIGTIPNNHPSLPTPAIDGATGDELNVIKLQASDQLRVGEWPHQVLGQNVWLRYEGVDANGSGIFLEDRKGEAHDTVGGLIRPVPLDWLKTLKDGSALSITFKVNFDGVASAATAVSFPMRTYTVKTFFDSDDHVQPISNYFIVEGRPPRTPPDRGTYTRTATGGTEPYRYSSSDSRVALVDPATGTVRAGSNGFAMITVTDATQRTASYRIEFLGITLVTRIDNIWWYPISAWREKALSLAELRVFWESYYPSEGPVAAALGWPTTLYWSNDNITVIGDAWAFRLNENIGSDDGKVQVGGGTRLPIVSKII
ncbi:Ig-like domain-containing protein [Pseudomonas sp. ZS1P83]